MCFVMLLFMKTRPGKDRDSSNYFFSNVCVNAPYFDGLTHLMRGVDGLPWWSPGQVLAIICGVWKCMRACTTLSGIYYSGPSW